MAFLRSYIQIYLIIKATYMYLKRIKNKTWTGMFIAIRENPGVPGREGNNIYIHIYMYKKLSRRPEGRGDGRNR